MITTYVVSVVVDSATAHLKRPIPRRFPRRFSATERSARSSYKACRHREHLSNPNHRRTGSPTTVDNGTPVTTWKRNLDLCCIFLSLPVILPLMAIVVLWIKLVSQGPAIFRQVRIGRDGKPFTLYKFRSMHLHADTRRQARHFSQLVESNSPMVKLDLLCDPRLIPGGCVLRAAGLDELPQLWNVLRGEMSLVGPRPCLPEEYGYFTSVQRFRFRALPGLTGIWQTEGKGITTFTEMNAMDADYVRWASLRMDLSIIWRTPCAILGQLRMAWNRRRNAGDAVTARAAVARKPIHALGTQRLG